MSLSAGIFGVAGTSLTEEEKRFFASLNPLGFILFARNCESPGQLKALVDSLKSLVGRDAFILIDQEGGRVARLKPPHWRKAPPAGGLAALSPIRRACDAIYANARLIAAELYALGINVDCAPLADVPVAGSHDIIGDRAFGYEPERVGVLAAQMAQGLIDGGVLPVLKHIPGHGRARADSHEELPVVDEPLSVLEKTDFVPFKALAHIPLGMTAHILYTALDATLPATLSPRVLNYIRDEIGFHGLLMSDDLSMKALKGNFSELASQTLAAGCDLVLHCNGKMEEMIAVAQGIAPLSDVAEARLARAVAQLTPPLPFDAEQAMHMLASLEEHAA